MKGLLLAGDFGMQPETVCTLATDNLVGISPFDKYASNVGGLVPCIE